MSSDRERDRAPPRGCLLSLKPELFKIIRLHSSDTPIDEFYLFGASLSKRVLWIENYVDCELALQCVSWDTEVVMATHVGNADDHYTGYLAVDGETSAVWGLHDDDDYVNPMPDFEYAKRSHGVSSVPSGIFHLDGEYFADACASPDVDCVKDYSAHGGFVYFVDARRQRLAPGDEPRRRAMFVIWRGKYHGCNIKFAEQGSIVASKLLHSKVNEWVFQHLVDESMSVWRFSHRPKLGKPMKIHQYSMGVDDRRVVLNTAPWCCMTDEFQTSIRFVTCKTSLVLWAINAVGDTVFVAVITAKDAFSPLETSYFAIGTPSENVRFFNAAMDNYAGVMLIYGCKMAQSADFFPEARYALYSVPIPGVERK